MQTETRELAPSSSLALSSGTQWSMQTETRELAPMSSNSTLLALRDGMQGSMQTETSERDPGKELTIGNIGMGTGQELATGSMARHDETRELAPNSLVSKLLALSDDMAQ